MQVEVYTASNGLDGFDFMQTHPDLGIISDIKMPKLNGIDLLYKVL